VVRDDWLSAITVRYVTAAIQYISGNSAGDGIAKLRCGQWSLAQVH